MERESSGPWIDALLSEVDAGRPVALVTAYRAGDPAAAKFVVSQFGPLAGEVGDAGLARAAQEAALDALATGRPRHVELGGVRLYAEPYLPPPALVVVGGGHVAQPLAAMAKLAGFEVTVLDDRPGFANRQRFPTADAVLCEPFRQGLLRLGLGPRHRVVLVTRGHRYDLECLRTVLPLPVGYVGMIGSRHRVDGIFARLCDEGWDPALLEKVYAPIGLDLGAETPAEIAVSIVAELVALRRGGTGEHLRARPAAVIHRERRRGQTGGYRRGG